MNRNRHNSARSARTVSQNASGLKGCTFTDRMDPDRSLKIVHVSSDGMTATCAVDHGRGFSGNVNLPTKLFRTIIEPSEIERLPGYVMVRSIRGKLDRDALLGVG